MKKTTICNLLLLFVLIPGTLFLGTQLSGRWYYLTSTMMIVEVMIPFFLAFETRRPQARELVTLAVMCALAVASRVVMLIPNFKPMTAIIMITGIALGAQSGFVCGAVGAFASNFFFSQGPWTPWQMMAYGFAGFLAGGLFHKRFPLRNPAALAVWGFFTIVLVIGPLLDSCTVFTVSSRITWKYALAVFTAGFAYNVQHGLACAVTLLLFAKPLLGKLERLKTKYGMMDARQGE
ncbi:MAG TPA: ECF transporter S component [Candidatus Faecousia faecavium]|nr:ECF transporter S component [Candidatus Faecousia faecavium]